MLMLVMTRDVLFRLVSPGHPESKAWAKTGMRQVEGFVVSPSSVLILHLDLYFCPALDPVRAGFSFSPDRGADPLGLASCSR